MNSSSERVAWIVSGAMVICTWMAAGAVKSAGQSFSTGCQSISSGLSLSNSSVHIPSQFSVSFAGGNSPVRITTENK